jgi:hypothetical protein
MKYINPSRKDTFPECKMYIAKKEKFFLARFETFGKTLMSS